MKRVTSILVACLAAGIVNAQQSLDLQAHRGGRALWPENTIPAMLNAVQLGIRTLELDCVISADNKVVVSHDPYMNAAIMLKPDGTTISETEEKSYTLYSMTYDSISHFDAGIKPHPLFPEQQKMKVIKPLLSALLDSVEAYVARYQLKPVHYNIETKYTVKGEQVLNPPAAAFVQLLMEVINSKGIADRVTIQSFDVRTLQVLHAQYPGQAISLLSSDKKAGLDEQLTRLGFVPAIYSPHYALVTPELVKKAHDRHIQVIPWTVNEEKEMQAMVACGVDGIISDCPDKLVRLFGRYQ